MKALRQQGGAIAFLLVLFILWEVLVRVTHTPMWLLPAPSAIFVEAAKSYDSFGVHILATVKLTVLGLGIGAGIGFIIALILHRTPIINRLVYPLLILSQNIPVIVLAPLLIIWFGFGLLPKLIILTLVCFFPVVVSTMDGLKNTDPTLKHYFEMMGATNGQTFWKLELPSALPSLFSGLKIAATYSVMGAVISEWLGAKQGIGVYMTLAQSSFRIDRVFVAIFAIMLLSMLFFGIIQLCERLIIKGQARGVAK